MEKRIMSEKLEHIKAMISTGVPIYKACDAAGISLRNYYRVTSGEDRLFRQRKIKRLKQRKEHLSKQLSKIESEIKNLETVAV